VGGLCHRIPRRRTEPLTFSNALPGNGLACYVHWQFGTSEPGHVELQYKRQAVFSNTVRMRLVTVMFSNYSTNVRKRCYSHRLTTKINLLLRMGRPLN
jgi:hypothetical protein